MPTRSIPAQDMDVPLTFPTQGIDLVTSYEAQRPETTPLALNVRAFEPSTLRARGGARPGLVQWIPMPVNGAFSVQEINSIVGTGVLYSGFTTSLTGIFVTGFSTGGWGLWNSGRQLLAGGFAGDVFQAVSTDGTDFWITSLQADGLTLRTQAITSGGATLWINSSGYKCLVPPFNGLPAPQALAILYQDIPGVGMYRFVKLPGASSDAGAVWKSTAVMNTAMGGGSWQETGGGESITFVGTTMAIAMVNALPGATTWTLGLITITAAGVVAGYVLSDTVTAGFGNFKAPWIINDGSAFYYCIPGGAIHKMTTGGSITWTATATTCGHGTTFGYVGADHGGTANLVIGGTTNANGVALNPSTGAALATSPISNNSSVIQDMLTQTGMANNLTIAVPQVSPGGAAGSQGNGYVTRGSCSTQPATPTLQWSTGPIPQIGPIAAIEGGSSSGYSTYSDYQRTILLLAVAHGLPFIGLFGVWFSTINGTDGASWSLSQSAPVVRSAANQGLMYFADGVTHSPVAGPGAGLHCGIYYDPGINTFTDWVVPGGNGLFPVDASNNGPRLIETWRGRTVLSGLLLDGQNWFMSAVGDPTNFNYSPASTTATQAVAGNNSPLGLVGDTITGIVPYTDDVLIFGCDHQLWMLRGDPMAGGRLDVISRELGMAWGRAWCTDPYGNLYFMSNRAGIYKYVPGEQPVRISQQIEQFLVDLSMDVVIVRLAWNDRFQGIDVYVTAIFGAALTNHYFWEQRNNAWWVDNFANNNHNPLVAYSFFGKTAGDRGVLIGSWDGFVRTRSPLGTTDDMTPISSYVVIGPLVTRELDQILFKDLQAVLSTTSGTVTYSVYVGASAQAALFSAPVITGTWGITGRNPNTWVRRSGHALYLKLSSTNPWALEAIRVRIQTQGRIQRRNPG